MWSQAHCAVDYMNNNDLKGKVNDTIHMYVMDTF